MPHVLNPHDVIDLDSSPNSRDVQQTTLSSNSLCSSSHSLDVSRCSRSLSAETITANLKLNKSEWIIVDVKNKKSDCWQYFGIPVRKLNGKKNEILDKLLSCKYCYFTYSFSAIRFGSV